MKKSKPIIITNLMLILLLSSYVAIAAEYGSKEDPLVSLSYIQEVLMPQTLENVDTIVSQRTEEYIKDLDSKMLEFQDEFDMVVSNDQFVDKVATKISESANTAQLVTMSSGQVFELALGTEILVREGVLALNSNGFINTTAGTAVNSSDSTIVNNLYLTVENSQTVTASAQSKVIIIGAYTIK